MAPHWSASAPPRLKRQSWPLEHGPTLSTIARHHFFSIFLLAASRHEIPYRIRRCWSCRRKCKKSPVISSRALLYGLMGFSGDINTITCGRRRKYVDLCASAFRFLSSGRYKPDADFERGASSAADSFARALYRLGYILLLFLIHWARPRLSAVVDYYSLRRARARVRSCCYRGMTNFIGLSCDGTDYHCH